MLSVFVQQEQRDEAERMEGSPQNESPVRPMPESRHDKENEGVPDLLELPATAASKGDVEIVAEPG